MPPYPIHIPPHGKDWKETYAAQHGFYGSMMNTLGTCVGTCGMIPCCPFPNPFKNVNQGSVGLISRFGLFYKVSCCLSLCRLCADLVEGCRPWSSQGQRVL